MARSNTPSSYKCSTCGVIGHNVRACPSRPAEELSATARLRLERAERKTARLAVKAEKDAAKAEKAAARAAAKVERDAAKAAAKAAKAAAKAPYVATVEPVIVIKPFIEEPVVDEVVSEPVAPVVEYVDALLREIEEDERARDAADLEAAIAATMPAAADEVDTSEALAADPDLAALLASIGVNAA
jgi:colicin import membrane protein